MDKGVKWPCLNRVPEAGSVVAVSTKYSILEYLSFPTYIEI
jgi:hypothetical protein